MAEIVVTGAAGFIGFHLCNALLDQGHQVFGVDNMTPYYDPSLKRARLKHLQDRKGFQFAQVDIADTRGLAVALDPVFSTMEVLVHLAAQAGVRYSLEAPRTYVQSNVVGHFNILELARHAPTLRHLVYASSSSVYGGSKRVPFAIDDPADQPVSLYAATKRSVELMSHSYAGLYKLPQTGLRFFTVYGPWGRPDMAYFKFTKSVLEGTPIEVFNHGEMRRDFTYVDDVVQGVLASLDRTPSGEVPHRLYNLGNDRPEELMTLISTIEKACGREAIKVEKPMQRGDVQATWADLALSRKDLGYDPKTKLEDGIPRFVSWYREYFSV